MTDVGGPAHACPLCGGPNRCVAAARGDFAAACWCEAASFPSSLIERVPEALRGAACICAACADAHAAKKRDAPWT